MLDLWRDTLLKNSREVQNKFAFQQYSLLFCCGDAGNRTRVRLISRYVSTMRVSPYIVGREVNEPNPTIASSIASLAPMTFAWSDPSYITPQFNRKEELSETAFRTRAYARAYAKAKLSAVKYGEATFCAVFALGFLHGFTRHALGIARIGLIRRRSRSSPCAFIFD